VIGFPLLFETQPRPLPADTPIEVRPRDLAAAPAVAPVPASRPAAVSAPDAESEAPGAATSDPAAAARSGDPGNDVDAPGVASTPALAASAAAPAAPRPAAAAVDRPAPAETQPPAVPGVVTAPAVAPTRADDGARARALLEGGSSAPSAARFVVQVGAFSDPGALRQARQRVEKLGLQTYTQVVNTAAGQRTRVRIGPYASREQADAAAAKVKAAGLPAAILAL